MAELADLEAFAGLLWDAVEVAPLRAVEDEHGKQFRRELPGGRLEPAHDLPLRDRQSLKSAEQLGSPGAGGQDERARLVAARFRLDLDAIAGRLPASHWLVLAHVGAELAGERHVRNDGPVCGQKAGLGLVHGFELRAAAARPDSAARRRSRAAPRAPAHAPGTPPWLR